VQLNEQRQVTEEGYPPQHTMIGAEKQPLL
jgi:hypothetical protein